MRKLDRQDLYDILYGCTILGTGGGGELDEGIRLIDEALSLDKEFVLADVDEISDGALVCTPYMLGSISPLPEEEEKKYERLPRIKEQPILAAVRRMEEYIGDKFYGTISCELGGANTAVSFYVAAMEDGYIVDADIAGRAVPEITNSTYYINGLPVAPIALANEFGETSIYENVIDDKRAEDIVRSIAMVSRNSIAAVDHALEMKAVRHAVIKNAISYALEIGRRFRYAKENGKDVAKEVAEAGDGFVGFRGKVKDYDWKTKSGFTFGNVFIDGTGEYEGNEFRIWFQNENLVSWLNGEVYVTLPDLICFLNTDTGEPVTNPNHEAGMNVAVVVLPAPEEFTTEKGLEAFGPKHFGFDFEYKPAQDRFK